MDRSAPFVITALVFATAAAWGIHLAIAPEPFARSSAAVLAIGLAVYGLIAVAGLLLSRGRWARFLAFGVVGGALAFGLVLDPGPWYVAGLVAGGLALIGLSGPWLLQGWIRHFTSADGPGARPTVLVLGAVGLVPIVGLASPSGLEMTHGILGAAGFLLAWAYARAETWGLWGLRLALPILSIGAIVQSPWGGRVLIVAAVAALTVLAWTKEAGRAVRPLLDRLPGPRMATPPNGPPS